MIFTGQSDQMIDGKHRVAIPKKFRKRLDPERDGEGLMIVPGRPLSTLWVYTETRFQELSDKWGSSLLPDQEQLDWEQKYFPLVEWVEIDSQGRVLLPEPLRNLSGLGREVTICGVRDHFEIRPRQSADAMGEALRELNTRQGQEYGGGRSEPGGSDPQGSE